MRRRQRCECLEARRRFLVMMRSSVLNRQSSNILRLDVLVALVDVCSRDDGADVLDVVLLQRLAWIEQLAVVVSAK